MGKDFLTLLNELRGPLKAYGILADDLDTKTLNKCKLVLAALDGIQAEREEHENALERLDVSFVTVAERTGISRKSLSENDTYRTLIAACKTPKEAKRDRVVAELSLELERYKKMEADMESVKKEQMALNLKYATVEQEKQEMKEEWNITKLALQDANIKIKRLEEENMTLRKTLEGYQGTYTRNMN